LSIFRTSGYKNQHWTYYAAHPQNSKRYEAMLSTPENTRGHKNA
jgi:hypothetical protein